MQRPASSAILLAFAAIYIIWGTTFVGIALVLRSMPPFFSGSVRFSVRRYIVFKKSKLLRADIQPQHNFFESQFVSFGERHPSICRRSHQLRQPLVDNDGATCEAIIFFRFAPFVIASIFQCNLHIFAWQRSYGEINVIDQAYVRTIYIYILL